MGARGHILVLVGGVEEMETACGVGWGGWKVDGDRVNMALRVELIKRIRVHPAGLSLTPSPYENKNPSTLWASICISVPRRTETKASHKGEAECYQLSSFHRIKNRLHLNRTPTHKWLLCPQQRTTQWQLPFTNWESGLSNLEITQNLSRPNPDQMWL